MGSSRSVRRSPATTSSAASRSRTTSRRSRRTSSRATTSTRTCSCTPVSAAPASTSRTAPRLKSTSTAASGRPSDKFAFDFGVWYYWYPGGQCFNAGRSARVLAERRRRLDGSAERQRDQGGPELLRNLRQGELHRKRQHRARRLRLLLAVGAELRRRWRVLRRHRQVHLGGVLERRAALHLRRSRPLELRHHRLRSTAARSPAAALRTTRRHPAARTTPPGTSASAGPGRCSRSICATSTPT